MNNDERWKITYEDASKYACMEVYMKENLIRKAPPESGLLFLGWETTLACNLKCKTCYSSSSIPKQNELSKQQVLSTFSDARKIGARLISLTGGEPFLRQDLPEILLETIQMGYEGIFLPTNGVIARDKLPLLAPIKDYVSIGVSLDGPNAEVNDSIRIPSSYKEAIESIKKAVEIGFTTIILMTVTQSNYHYVDEMLTLAQKLGVDQLALRRAVPSGRGLDNFKTVCPLPQQAYESWEQTVGSSMDVKFYDPVANTMPGVPELKFGGCTAGVCGMVLCSDGDLIPCPELRVVIGNIYKDNISDIWYNSPILKKIRNRDLLDGKCGKCNNRWSCGGCRGVGMNIHGDYLAEDSMCWNIK